MSNAGLSSADSYELSFRARFYRAGNLLFPADERAAAARPLQQVPVPNIRIELKEVTRLRSHIFNIIAYSHCFNVGDGQSKLGWPDRPKSLVTALGLSPRGETSGNARHPGRRHNTEASSVGIR
jgi:hypothetical protein